MVVLIFCCCHAADVYYVMLINTKWRTKTHWRNLIVLKGQICIVSFIIQLENNGALISFTIWHWSGIKIWKFIPPHKVLFFTGIFCMQYEFPSTKSWWISSAVFDKHHLGIFLSFETTNFYESICHDSCVCVVCNCQVTAGGDGTAVENRQNARCSLRKNATRWEQRLGSSHENKGALWNMLTSVYVNPVMRATLSFCLCVTCEKFSVLLLISHFYWELIWELLTKVKRDLFK